MMSLTLLEIYAILLAAGLVLMFLALVIIVKNIISVNKKLTELIRIQSENIMRETVESAPAPVQETYPTYGNNSNNYRSNNQ